MTFGPLYVSRPLLNGQEVAQHFIAQGLGSTLDPAEMHITVLYSKQPFHWEKVPPTTGDLVVPPMRRARGVGVHSVDRQMKKLGGFNVVAMEIQAQNEGVQKLIERWWEYRAAGASHDYDGFNAHITVSYAGTGVDVSKIKPFPGVLRFGPEIRKPIEKDWKPDLTKERPAAKSVHPGHRDNPVDVVAPGDLDRAVKRVWDPTEAQAAAGNYGKAHAVVGGLPVTIETPRDRVRSGTGPGGRLWSVVMPAHYGYVKRTEGADGDHVDVYIGPDAHAAGRLPVWVVDQVDADTRAWDEHKAMLGFPHREAARDAYLAAFSDGRGRERVGAVARMTFSEFLYWLRHGDTAVPLLLLPVAKSVRTVVFTPTASGCGGTDTACGCRSGGTMPDTQPAASPRGVGLLSKAIALAWPGLNKAQREDLIKDAAVTAGVELGKAENHLLTGEGIPMVEDQWDGPPDDRIKTVAAYGPDSSVPAGSVGVGPSQDASGAGADRMEREYSRPTPQKPGSVQMATEALGAKLRAHGAALKSFMAFGKSMDSRLGMIEATMSTAAVPTLDAAAVDAAVAKAVSGALAKAVPEIVRAVAKAAKAKGKGEGEGESDKDAESESGSGEDEEEEEDEDEEAEQEESGSGTEIEIVNELEEEGEGEDENEAKKAAHKAAAQERLTAKGLVRLARKAAADASDAMDDGMMHAGKRHHKKAAKRMAKARMHAAVAKSLRGGNAGASMKAIEASIAGVAKALKESRAKNQDKWPTGKSAAAPATSAAAPAAAAAAAVPAAQSPDVVKAMTELAAAVAKANAGYALLTADVQKVMQIVGGQSRSPDASSGPPVTELFKGDVLTFDGKTKQINELWQNREITAADRDKAMDALNTMRQPGLPSAMVDATIAACPAPVQAILKKAA